MYQNRSTWNAWNREEKMDMYNLSIIIPVYNMEPYLRRCVDSVIAQKYANLEIVIVDDGSEDYSGIICDEYAHRDNRIKVIHKPNGGLVSARKAGLAAAEGAYITYVDADDWIEEHTYDDLMKVVEEYGPDLIACSFIKEFGNFRTVREDYPREGYYSKEIFREIVQKAGDEAPFFCQVICGSLCCKIVKKDFLWKYQNAVPDEIALSEDLAVTLPMIANANSIYVSKKNYYHYCQNKSSMCWEWETGSYRRLEILVKYLRESFANCRDGAFLRLMLHSIYFSMMDLLYDIPAEYFKEGIPFLKEIKKTSKVVVYGKGVYASNLIEVIQRYKLCSMVKNVDSGDADLLFQMQQGAYDYIVIAILDYMVVDKVKDFLIGRGIAEEVILTIGKEALLEMNLPKSLQREKINQERK